MTGSSLTLTWKQLPRVSTSMRLGGLYLEGQRDLISRLITGIIRVSVRVIGVINLLTKSRPSK